MPSFFTQNERKAVLEAAELAHLNVLSLINENTAAAVQYGIDLKFELNTTTELILYDLSLPGQLSRRCGSWLGSDMGQVQHGCSPHASHPAALLGLLQGGSRRHRHHHPSDSTPCRMRVAGEACVRLLQTSKKANATVGQVEVLGNAYDSTLGGAHFDKVVFDFLWAQAQKVRSCASCILMRAGSFGACSSFFSGLTRGDACVRSCTLGWT